MQLIETALDQLAALAIPRDLIEVIVNVEGAARHFPNARTPGRDTFRFAAIGGLVGLIVGAATSLIMIAVPGFTVGRPGSMSAFVQLLGPNALAILGAMIGALFGTLRHQQQPDRYAPAAEIGSDILVVVQARSPWEFDAVYASFTEIGGRVLDGGDFPPLRM